MLKAVSKAVFGAFIMSASRVLSDCLLPITDFISSLENNSCDRLSLNGILKNDTFCTYKCLPGQLPSYFSQHNAPDDIFYIGCARQKDENYKLTSSSMCVPGCEAKNINSPTILILSKSTCHDSILAQGSKCEAFCTSNPNKRTILTCVDALLSKPPLLAISPVCTDYCSLEQLAALNVYPIAISTGPTAVIGQVTVDSSNSYNCNPGYFVRKKAEKTLLSSIEILCLKNGTLKTDQACLEVCQDFPAVITSCEGYTRLILGEECVPSCRGSLVTRSGDVLKCKKNEEILGDGMMCEENCQNQPPELNLAEVCNLCDLSHAVGVVRVLVNSIEAENKRVALNTAFSVVCADTYRSYFNTYTCDEKIDHDFICIKNCVKNLNIPQIQPISVQRKDTGYMLTYKCPTGYISTNGFNVDSHISSGTSICAGLIWDIFPRCFGYCSLAQLALPHGVIEANVLPDTKALPYSCEHGFSVANRTAVVCGWHSKAGFSLSAEPACLADECVDVAVGDLASRVVCQVEGDTTRCQYACRDGFISGSARAQRPEQTADYVRGEFLYCVVPPNVEKEGFQFEAIEMPIHNLAFEGEDVRFQCRNMEKQSSSKSLFGKKEYTAVCKKGGFMFCGSDTDGIVFIVVMVLSAVFLSILGLLCCYIRKMRARNMEEMRNYRKDEVETEDLSAEENEIEIYSIK